jgi:hypothetical protein
MSKCTISRWQPGLVSSVHAVYSSSVLRLQLAELCMCVVLLHVHSHCNTPNMRHCICCELNGRRGDMGFCCLNCLELR